MSYIHLFKNKSQIINEIIRVDHAGELGAKYIYLGQLKALGEDIEIIEMLEGEIKHLEYFENAIKASNVRPSILNIIWKDCAFLMGFIIAKTHARNGAMLCTKEVEDVIEKHYTKQIKILNDLNIENDLKEKVTQFREEEISHLDIGEKNSNENKLITMLVKNITKLAIYFSTKF